MRRTIQGTAIGNFMEWYDFGVYGFIATTIARVFYPGDEVGSGSLLATFGTLAAAFAARPVGGLVFGALGDRFGRKPVLVATIALMAVGTTGTGVLPDYRAIGVWAPILLVLTRVVQGFSTGGEYVGAMIFVGEHAPDRKRGKLAGFLPMSSQGGYVLAGALVTGLQTWLPEDDMLHWGWRVPLLLSAPMGIIAVAMRLRLEESPAYQAADGVSDGKDAERQPLRETIAQQRKPLLIVIGLVLVYNVTDYILTGYLPTYLTAIVRVGHSAGLAMIVLTLLATMATVVAAAALSDRIGVKPLLWAGCVLLLLFSVPAFLLIGSHGGYPVVFGGVLLIGAMLLCFDSTLPATLPALFPTTVRYGALAVGFNISVSTFGGTTPMIAEALVSATGDVLVPAYLLMAAGLIGAVALWFTPEVAGRRLPGSGPSVETEAEARELTAPHGA